MSQICRMAVAACTSTELTAASAFFEDFQSRMAAKWRWPGECRGLFLSKHKARLPAHCELTGTEVSDGSSSLRLGSFGA